jgi:hypothetical protein
MTAWVSTLLIRRFPGSIPGGPTLVTCGNTLEEIVFERRRDTKSVRCMHPHRHHEALGLPARGEPEAAISARYGWLAEILPPAGAAAPGGREPTSAATRDRNTPQATAGETAIGEAG